MSSPQESTESDDDEEMMPRRKFTLTEDVIEVLNRKAESEFAGNRSAFVRAAVKEKADRPDHREIRVELQQLRELLEEELLPQVSQQSKGTQQNTGLRDRQQTDDSPVVGLGYAPDETQDLDSSRIARMLIRELPKPNEDPVRLSVLEAGVDEPLAAVTAGIQQLSQRGMIERMDQDGCLVFRMSDTE
jgi:Arc/MetJ-type ribon-helix-helix transcriptional regulator